MRKASVRRALAALATQLRNVCRRYRAKFGDASLAAPLRALLLRLLHHLLRKFGSTSDSRGAFRARSPGPAAPAVDRRLVAEVVREFLVGPAFPIIPDDAPH